MDPLEQLSDQDLHALAGNNLESMSDHGLQILASSGKGSDQKLSDGLKMDDEPLGHQLIRQGLPIAGQIAGGLGGTALAGPVGGIGGAAAGSVAGGEAAGWLNHAVYGDEAPSYDSADDAKRIGINAAIGAGSELGGQAIAKGAGAVLGKMAPAAAQVSKEVPTGILDATGAPITKTVQETATTQAPKVPEWLSGVADKALTYAGAKVAGPAGAVLAPMAGRAVGKTLSATANGLGKVLQDTPSYFGKWAPVLTNAAARGELSLNAASYVLQQQDPEFRKKMQNLNNIGSETADSK